jgi:hypothetical protein
MATAQGAGRLGRVAKHLLGSPRSAGAALALPTNPDDDDVQRGHPDMEPVQMSEEECFMFDLHGFLIVRQFLSSGEVKALNDATEANWERRGDFSPRSYDQLGGMLQWPHPHCQPFRDLLAHIISPRR